MVTPRSLARDPRHSRLFSTDFIFRRTRDTLYSLRYVRANKSTKLLPLPCSTHALANSLSHAHHALFDRPRSVIPPAPPACLLRSHIPSTDIPSTFRSPFLNYFSIQVGKKRRGRIVTNRSFHSFLSWFHTFFLFFTFVEITDLKDAQQVESSYSGGKFQMNETR